MPQSRVLLVGDNPEYFEVVRFLLERAIYQMMEAQNGLMGLDLARQELPNLFLMNLSLPDLDGLTPARRLKADPKTASNLLLALTAHTLPSDWNQAFESGFEGYISKPVISRVLLWILLKLCGL
jgi:two-component system, cell cycle response regulator DivK